MTTIPYKHEETSEHTSMETIAFWGLILLAVAGPAAGMFYLTTSYFDNSIGAFCAGVGVWLVCLLLLMALALTSRSEAD